MFKSLIIIFAAIVLSSCTATNTFYVVRHAEKDGVNSNMTSDVPLSAAGAARAEALKELLKNKKITKIYSTSYIRTKTTAAPLAAVTGLPVEVYNSADTSFIKSLRERKGNTLIVGHSNTVDDIVNALLGWNELKDLPDSQYGDLWILKKKGNKWTFQISHYGN